jgi:hypothetical protein
MFSTLSLLLGVTIAGLITFPFANTLATITATNLLCPNVASGTDTLGNSTGFSFGKAVLYGDVSDPERDDDWYSSLTSTNETAWQGRNSLDVDLRTGFPYDRTKYEVALKLPRVLLQPDTEYTFSVHVRAGGVVNSELCFWGAGAAILGVTASSGWNTRSATFLTKGHGQFERFSLTFSTLSGSGDGYYELWVTGLKHEYLDGFQLEEGPVAGAWVEGSGTSGCEISGHSALAQLHRCRAMRDIEQLTLQ